MSIIHPCRLAEQFGLSEDIVINDCWWPPRSNGLYALAQNDWMWSAVLVSNTLSTLQRRLLGLRKRIAHALDKSWRPLPPLMCCVLAKQLPVRLPKVNGVQCRICTDGGDQYGLWFSVFDGYW